MWVIDESESHVEPMPLQAAEDRLQQTKSFLRIVEPMLHEHLDQEGQRLSTLLDEVLGQPRPHPQYGEFGVSAADYRHKQVEQARAQLPTVLFNSLLTYTVSLLEAMLQDAVDHATAITQREAPAGKGRSIYHSYVSQLGKLGVRLRVPDSLEAALAETRTARNRAVHEAQPVRHEEVVSGFDALEELLAVLRSALISFEAQRAR